MRYYYKKFGNRYAKVTVDDNHGGTKDDPDEVIDFCFIDKDTYEKECKNKKVIYEQKLKEFKNEIL